MIPDFMKQFENTDENTDGLTSRAHKRLLERIPMLNHLGKSEPEAFARAILETYRNTSMEALACAEIFIKHKPEMTEEIDALITASLRMATMCDLFETIAKDKGSMFKYTREEFEQVRADFINVVHRRQEKESDE